MRTVLFLIIVFALLVFPAAGFCDDPILDKAWTCYLRSDYNEALNACRAVSKSRPLGEEGRYLMGLSFLKLGLQKKARENFEFVIKNYPYTNLKEELLLGIAGSYYLEGDFKRAEEYYKRLLKNFKTTDYASIVYLSLGKALRKQGKWEEAEGSFYKVTRSFPLSLEAKEAKSYLLKDHFFSVQVGAFAKKNNASKLVNTLKRKGYNAVIEKQYDGENILYKVKAGTFNTKAMAGKEVKRLKSDGFSPRITS
jgi:tetratricopeptide (TPR) repeat protein